MSAWTRLAGCASGTLWLAAFATIVGGATAGCGGDDESPAADAAPKPDGPPSTADAGPDAAPPSPYGSWRLTRFTNEGVVVNDTDTTVGADVMRVSGLINIARASGEGGVGLVIIKNGRSEIDTAAAAPASFNASFDELTLADSAATVVYDSTSGAEVLTVKPTDREYRFVRPGTTSLKDISIAGQVSLNETVTLVKPRLALIAIRKDGQGAPTFNFIPGQDVALPATFGQDAAAVFDYKFDRVGSPLGVERSSYVSGSDTAEVAINLVVAYEDRNDNGALDRWVVDTCDGKGVDCIRAVSEIGLQFVLGDSAAWRASSYDFFIPRWSWAAIGSDGRFQDERLTLLPLDPSTKPVPADLRIFAAPDARPLPKLLF
jgi:hypothetical protein